MFTRLRVTYTVWIGYAALLFALLSISVAPRWQNSAQASVVFETSSPRYQVLHAFGGQQAPAGDRPYGYVIPDRVGNVYGTTSDGGGGGQFNFPFGVIYKLDRNGKETVLHKFNGGPTDGEIPWAGLVADPVGNLYGTTSGGGSLNFGSVFKLSNTGSERLLYSFHGNDGAIPLAALVIDAAGNLYGTTTGCGASGLNCGDQFGKVFKIDQSGKETVLHTFTKTNGGGEFPQSGLIRDAAGNLYGTTQASGGVGHGTVYKLDTAGRETVLHTFMGPEGKWPQFGSLIADASGNLYGVTNNGGKSNVGVVFKLAPTGKFTVLYDFKGGVDGGNPNAPLVRDAAGNIYGTAPWGGGIGCGGGPGCGIIFKIDSAGRKSVLHSFSSGNDGANPLDGLIADSSGNLYGVTEWGGDTTVQCGGITTGCGVVFKLSLGR